LGCTEEVRGSGGGGKGAWAEKIETNLLLLIRNPKSETLLLLLLLLSTIDERSESLPPLSLTALDT
jgi:hypothetical protein